MKDETDVMIEAYEIEQLLLCQYDMVERIGFKAERYMKSRISDVTEANLIMHELERLYRRILTINDVCREKAITIQAIEEQ